jgi:hypothetical protein
LHCNIARPIVFGRCNECVTTHQREQAVDELFRNRGRNAALQDLTPG